MNDAANISITRLFQILELFKTEQRPLTATFIQNATGCPRSSLNLLLKSVVNLGYLTFHRKTNAYFPCIQLEQLTSWLLPTILQDHSVGALLNKLRAITRETVILSMRSDLDMEVVRVATSNQAIALHISPGARFPIWSTAVGLAALSSLKQTELKRLYHRSGSLPKDSLNGTLRAINAMRKRGYSVSAGAVLEHVRALAAPLPTTFAGRELVLSVGGPDDRIAKNEQALGQALLQCISDFTQEQALD